MDGADLAPREFLGVGWAWPVEATADGEIALARYEESVRQSVWIILGTSPGERVMRPDFGCGLQDLVFSVGNATTEGLVAEEIRRSLIRWEPRLDLVDLQVAADPARVDVLLVRITYRVRATNNVFNLVYPFYLERGEA
jgi:Bacteriophage baseplate protein W